MPERSIFFRQRFWSGWTDKRAERVRLKRPFSSLRSQKRRRKRTQTSDGLVPPEVQRSPFLKKSACGKVLKILLPALKMNIRGVLFLIRKKLPITRSAVIVRELSEIPQGILKQYAETTRLAMRVLDDRIKITETPYQHKKEPTAHDFSPAELELVHKKLCSEYDVPKEHQLIYVCEVFRDSDINLSGQAHKGRTGSIHIDMQRGNRPCGRDWQPQASYKSDGQIIDGEGPFVEAANRVIIAMRRLPVGSYVDFSQLNDGYLFYHDYCCIREVNI